LTAEDDIAAYLASKGRGTLPDPATGVVGTIFVNDKPSTPDALISVSGYAGQAPEWTNTTKYDRPSVQVLVRGGKNAAGAARTLIETIKNDLDGLSGYTGTGTYYELIWTEQSGPAPMGKDENGRIEYVWNFYTRKTR
jgi:hypothetical protein